MACSKGIGKSCAPPASLMLPFPEMVGQMDRRLSGPRRRSIETSSTPQEDTGPARLMAHLLAGALLRRGQFAALGPARATYRSSPSRTATSIAGPIHARRSEP